MKKELSTLSASSEEWVGALLEGLDEKHLLREVRDYTATGGKIETAAGPVLNFGSNDYLDLAHHPEVVHASIKAVERYGAGATASRLTTGSLPIHRELEESLASYKGYSSALLFGSGYLANVGTIPALVGRDDEVFADRLVHASILDGVALSRATLRRFRHNDVAHLEGLLSRRNASRRALVITESVFSMNGDQAPLEAISDLATRHGCMIMVDEAHATGVFGPEGSGLVRQHGIESAVNVSMANMGKALGGYGGFVACSSRLRDLFVNGARAFIYTTAPPPAAVGAALGALKIIRREPAMGPTLLSRASTFRECLRSAGFEIVTTDSPIVPIMVGDSDKALTVARRLLSEHVLAPAIRPPTVEQGTARLRLSVTLAHTPEDLDHAAGLLARAAHETGVL